jgi:murein L,D-transpeptidase YcbB/YkuD
MVITLTSLLAYAARAEEAASESEILQARVEQIRDDASFRISGARIVAKRLVAELYARRGFTLLWTAPAAREDLLRAIRDSADDGLEPEDYLLSALQSARSAAEAPGASLDAQIDYELLQSEALIRLFYHLIFGKVDPTSFDATWNFTRKLHLNDPAAFVQQSIDSGELYARIEREKPQHDMYRKLKAEFARHRALAAKGGWTPIPAGPTLKPGSTDSRVRELRARLAATGDLAADAPLDSLAYDDAVETAVKAFQTRHGLGADGSVGPATLAELNVPIGARVSEIRVNLERGRWLLHDLDPTLVIVNVAGYEVYYLRDGKVVWSARAQVGKPYRATPIFRSTMTYLVLNPTWTVPPTILANDILPSQRRDRSTLARKRLEVVDHSGRSVPESSIDWANATPRNFRYMLRQQPGPENALGQVKFMFPNAYSVYLHDTPSKSLFEKSERALSSGCIRIENPFELADLLLEGQSDWDRAAIERAIAAGKTRTVTLARPVPVLLSYWTAWVDRNGALQLRPDIYGRDAKVAAGLDAGFSFRRQGS